MKEVNEVLPMVEKMARFRLLSFSTLFIQVTQLHLPGLQ